MATAKKKTTAAKGRVSGKKATASAGRAATRVKPTAKRTSTKKAAAAAGSETQLKVGDRAPEFTLPDEAGDPIQLKDLKGQSVILYFYPKDDTPGCTMQACGFRDARTRVTKAKAAVIGVSLDGAESHQRFIDKYDLPFTLLSDTDAAVSKQYGVYKEKNMYGKKYWGIERTTFVIDPQGLLKAIFRKVKVDGHIEEVLATLK
ncbi:MAG: thioredoxin-dependent thiol peroxidase [Nitrospiraceae bacterium]